MTVQELRTKLTKYPDDMEVMFPTFTSSLSDDKVWAFLVEEDIDVVNVYEDIFGRYRKIDNFPGEESDGTGVVTFGV